MNEIIFAILKGLIFGIIGGFLGSWIAILYVNHKIIRNFDDEI